MRFTNEQIFSHQFDEDANKYNNIKFDANVLDLMCRYMVSENSHIKRVGYSNIRRFLESINPSDYRDDVRLNKIEFINRALNARLDFNIDDRNTVLNHITGLGISNEYSLPEISNDEVIWIDTIIEKALAYTYVYRSIPKLKNLISELEHCDPTTRDVCAMNLLDSMQNVITEHRQSVIDHNNETYFSLVGNQYVESVSEYYNVLTNPSNKLRVGTKRFNILLNGGFEGGRVYNFIGVPSDGKSLTLVDIALQLKEYNRDYKPKDKTKIPTVVILTMENACRETFERIFKMIYGQCDLSMFSVEQIIEILSGKGLCVTPDNPINIVVKYKANLSVSTSYYYELYDELLMNGMEMIALVHDYTKRIKSAFNSYNSDERLRLGAVINEDKAFAISKNIPVITASQFNRDGIKIVEEARANNMCNIVSKLNRANVGESALIIENSDGAYAIAYEYKYNQNGDRHKWMGFKNLKSRSSTDDTIDTLYIPYSNHSSIKLQEDLYTNYDCSRLNMIDNGIGNMVTYNDNGIIHSKGVNEYGYSQIDRIDPSLRSDFIAMGIEDERMMYEKSKSSSASDYFKLNNTDDSDYSDILRISSNIKKSISNTITIDTLFKRA